MTISSQSKAFAIGSIGISPSGRNPDVAVLADGRFVVVWQEVLGSPADGFTDTDGAIFARIYNANGTAAGEAMQVNIWWPGVQSVPQVAATVGGGFVVSFRSTLVWGDRPTDIDLFAVRFDSTGTLDPYRNSAGDLINYRDIVPDSPGDPESAKFMVDLGRGYVAFVKEGTAARVSIEAPDGTSVNSDSLVAFQQVSDVARLANGNIVIAGETGGIVALRLSDPTLIAAPVGIPGLVGPVDFVTMLSFEDARDVRITALNPGSFAPNSEPGGFVVSALQPKGSNSSTLVMESFTAWGSKISSNSFDIAISLNSDNPDYDVLALNDGTYVVG